MNRLVRMYNTTPLLAVQSQGLIISAGYINFISRDFSSIEAELAYVPRSYKLIHAHTHTLVPLVFPSPPAGLLL